MIDVKKLGISEFYMKLQKISGIEKKKQKYLT